MSTVVTRALNITTSNVEQYCTASGLTLNAAGYAFRLYLNGGTTGYAILNSAAKEVLYPSAAAKPFKLDSSIRGSRNLGTMSAALQFGGTAVHSESFTSSSFVTKTKSGVTDDSIISSTQSTEICWKITGNSKYNSFRVASTELTLYFNQYACAANAVGDGIASAVVSNAAPYQGESVTFTATLQSGATWHGWYSDAACTQLVSTSLQYTTSAADLTLYAKATREVTGTGIYAKVNGSWAEAQYAHKKVNGVWVLQSDISAVRQEMQNGNYQFKEVTS